MVVDIDMLAQSIFDNPNSFNHHIAIHTPPTRCLASRIQKQVQTTLHALLLQYCHKQPTIRGLVRFCWRSQLSRVSIVSMCAFSIYSLLIYTIALDDSVSFVFWSQTHRDVAASVRSSPPPLTTG